MAYKVTATGGRKPTGKPTTVGYEGFVSRETAIAVLNAKAYLMVGKTHPNKGSVSEAMTAEEIAVIDFGSLIDQSEDATIVFTSVANPALVYPMQIKNLNITKYRTGVDQINFAHADFTTLQTAVRADRGIADLTITSARWGS